MERMVDEKHKAERLCMQLCLRKTLKLAASSSRRRHVSFSSTSRTDEETSKKKKKKTKLLRMA